MGKDKRLAYLAEAARFELAGPLRARQFQACCHQPLGHASAGQPAGGSRR